MQTRLLLAINLVFAKSSARERTTRQQPRTVQLLGKHDQQVLLLGRKSHRRHLLHGRAQQVVKGAKHR